MNALKSKFLFVFFAALAATSCRTGRNLHQSETKNPSTAKEKNVAASHSKIKATYSTLLGVDEKEVKNMQLYSLIDEWYGTSYKYGGCDKKGIDCSNFISILYQELFHISLKGSSASIFNQCRVIDKKELQEGDLLFFKPDNKNISHIGMYLQNNRFVHATTKKGVMINDLNESYYLNCFYKAARLKELNN